MPGEFIFPGKGCFDYYLGPIFGSEWMYRLPLIAIVCIATPLAADPVGVRLESASYADLAAEIKGLKGKVVLVDVWGSFCAPCKEKFPHVVALHEKFAKQGLVVISVSVDPPDDVDARAAAQAFLMKQRATFRNLQLTDKAEVWQAKWNVVGPPLLFLFDREGKLASRWEGKIDPGELSRRVAELCGK
jgi:thiol-disulfide isomerase/thioredoxin